MCAIHIKTIRGHEYAYDVTSYWDKEQKKYRKKAVYVGKVIDKEKGIYEKRRDGLGDIEDHLRDSLILSFGDAYALSELLKMIPPGRLMEKILPDERDTLMDLVSTGFLKTPRCPMPTRGWRGIIPVSCIPKRVLPHRGSANS